MSDQIAGGDGLGVPCSNHIPLHFIYQNQSERAVGQSILSQALKSLETKTLAVKEAGLPAVATTATTAATDIASAQWLVATTSQ